jgi:L-lysine exporter family protein LysE/ArgO
VGRLTCVGEVAPQTTRADAPGRVPGPVSLRVAVLTVLGFTWLNPHVYLDTLVFLGSVATSHGAHKWWFGAGAALASLLWFSALGYGARLLAPLFERPVAWRILDGIIAVVMITLGVTLALGT